MKKILLLIALFMGMQLNYAQDLGAASDISTCSSDLTNSLQSCLLGNGINFTFLYSGNSIYIIGKGSPAPGKIESCIARYNNDARDCPDAPVIINNPH